MKTKSLILAMVAALACLQDSLADQSVPWSFDYNCYVLNYQGGLINDSLNSEKISLNVYKIADDGQGGQKFGTLVQSSYTWCEPSEKGFNCNLQILVTSDGSDNTATIGEQLALVVKKDKEEVWRSYTALPPVGEAFTSCYVGGILSDADANGDGIADQYVEDVLGWAEAYEFAYGNADADDDGDGVSNLVEFYAQTNPTEFEGLFEMEMPNTLTLKDWSVDEISKKATVTIDCQDGLSYSICYTTDPSWRGLTTGKMVKFATTAEGAETLQRLGYFNGDGEIHTQQVWFTLPDVNEDYYVGIAVDGVLCAYTKIASASVSHTITWLDTDGTEIGTTSVADGKMPEHDAPTKSAEAPYVYTFTGWTPEIVAASADATYTATFAKVADLSLVTGDWTAVDGDVITNSTSHAVTVPAGARVTVNGVTIYGAAGGGAEVPAPEFSDGGKSATTAFAKGENGAWTLTTFAELANDAIGADVTEDQIKVYAADTLEGLKTAKPLASGVTVTEKKSAVKTTIEVVPPAEAAQQFFKVEFGE